MVNEDITPHNIEMLDYCFKCTDRLNGEYARYEEATFLDNKF